MVVSGRTWRATIPHTTRIYVGPWKTGTSSVRAWLREATPSLSRLGVEYLPDDDRAQSWMFPVRSARRLDVASWAFLTDRWPRHVDWAELRRSEAERAARAADLLLASEYFHLATHPSVTFAEALGENVLVACTVRHQADVADSLAKEMLKEPDVSLDDALRMSLAFTLDYRAIAERWCGTGAAVWFVPHGPDVVPGVAMALRLPPPIHGRRFRENTGLPSGVALHLFGRKREFMGQGTWAASVEGFTRAFPPFAERFKSGSMHPTDVRQRIERQHEAGNADLVARHPELAHALRFKAVEQARLTDRQTALCDRLLDVAMDEAERKPSTGS